MVLYILITLPTTPPTRQAILRVTFAFEYLFLNVAALFLRMPNILLPTRITGEIQGGGEDKTTFTF